MYIMMVSNQVIFYSAECGGLRKIEANVNLMVQLKERIQAPSNYFLNDDGNLSLMGLCRGRSNMKCASFSIAL